MDFFEHQDRARRNTGRLVLLFTAAVVCITALVYGLVVVVMLVAQNGEGSQGGNALGAGAPPPLPYLETLGLTAAGVSLVVGGSSAFKIAQLRSGGGDMVASSLGGRRLDPDTADPLERKVLNVVEEMSIASGLPVPPVYLMDDEPGINAFAAGYTPETAVIGVTRGCAERLTRDELQGVMAHEFSHILNGDMRLNIKLMGVVFGILALTVIGRVLMRSAFYTRSRNSKDGGGKIAIFLIGLALIVIGYLGVLFGKLIQAAVSRQREFLADASAVQFTRNPEGIAGALKRIGGVYRQGRVASPHAEETAHLFFCNAVSAISGAFATHPPLPDRIRRIEPRWDGKFYEPDEAAAPTPVAGAAMGFAGGGSPAAPSTEGAPTPPAQAGVLDAEHLAHARQILDALPSTVVAAARQPVGAQALVFALLLDEDADTRAKQLAVLETGAPVAMTRLAPQLAEALERVDRSYRLPALDLAVPALAQLAGVEYRKLRKLIEQLVLADEKVSVFEQVLQQVMERHIGVRFGQRADPPVKHTAFAAVREPARVVLSILAYSGSGGEESDAAKAFEAGTAVWSEAPLTLVPKRELGGRVLAQAINELSLAAPLVKRTVVDGCLAAVKADRQVTSREAELTRLVVESIGVPVPPLLPGQAAA